MWRRFFSLVDYDGRADAASTLLDTYILAFYR